LAIAGINKRIAANTNCFFMGDINSAANEGTVSNPSGYAWDLDGDGQFDDALGLEVQWTWTWPGLYGVAVQATDSTGALAIDHTEVRIHPPKGDVNGDGRIDLVDLRLAYQAALGLIVLSPEEQYRADLNDDGVVDMEDVTLLCGMILGGCG
ncbi:MAG: dockerin type I repeat-containing protein, partial [Candidatus Bipolaricaulaceae bacterium]